MSSPTLNASRPSWLLRALPMTVVHIVVRVLLGVVILHSPLHGNLWKTLAIAVLVLVALVWGGIDGLRDARAHPDPDDYEDLTVAWLKAGLLAGLLAGIVCYLVGRFWIAGIGQAGFFVEIFAGTSFSALLIFVPAMVGVFVGRFIARREQRKADDRHQELATA